MEGTWKAWKDGDARQELQFEQDLGAGTWESELSKRERERMRKRKSRPGTRKWPS